VRALLAASLVACSFNPAALPTGSSADAPIVEPPDAPAPDAPAPDARPRADAGAPDAPPPDAGPPDAEPDPCPVKSAALSLGTPADGMIDGTSRYLPSCAGGNASGPEAFYHVDVNGGPSTELVVDVTDVDAALDTVLDVTGTCMGMPGVGICADVGAPGAGEVVVVPLLAPGRRYIAADSAAATHGRYSVVAFLRAVVAKGAVCAPELTTSRCQLGEYCVDLDDDGTAKCEDLATTTDSGFNDDACAAGGNPAYRISADSAYLGSLDDGTDVDVLELDPTANATLRVVVDDGAGGCGADLALDLLGGIDCSHTSVVVTDENSGLGPCPLLRNVQLVGGQRYWLRVRAGAGAQIKPGAMYTMVVDFVY